MFSVIKFLVILCNFNDNIYYFTCSKNVEVPTKRQQAAGAEHLVYNICYTYMHEKLTIIIIYVPPLIFFFFCSLFIDQSYVCRYFHIWLYALWFIGKLIYFHNNKCTGQRILYCNNKIIKWSQRPLAADTNRQPPHFSVCLRY